MSDENTGPAFQVGFSIQDPPAGFTGKWIGVHWDVPLAQFVVGMPLDAAEELARQFTTDLTRTIATARRQASGLVVAPDNALKLLKGK